MSKILIVDDNPTNRDLLVRLLVNRGHSLRGASDGAEALTLMSAEHPDLVITEILMPTMDGYEFVCRLRSTADICQTPVVFCTAHFREQDATDLARDCGVECVLTKPIEPETFFRAVDRCLGNGIPMPKQTLDQEHLRLITDKLSEQTSQLNSTNRRLEALIDISLQLASETLHHRLLENFCISARGLISSKYALVGIASEDGRALADLCVAGVDLQENPVSKNLPASQQAIASLLTQGQPLRKRNPGGDPKALGFPSEYPNFQSLLVAPIASLTQSYGWLCLFHRLGAVEFSEEDERLVAILGALVGRIYENGKMYAIAQRHAIELEQEVAERKKAEEALRASEARHRLLYFENSPLPGWLYDTESLRFLDVNDAAILHYGYTRDEFLSMTIKDIRPCKDVAKLLDLTPQISPGVQHSGRWKHRKKDGTVIDVEILSYSLNSPRPVAFGLVYDITERLRSEALAQEASERLNIALRASRTGVWSWDTVKDQIAWDAYAYEIFGLPPGSFGGTFADLLATLHPEDREILSNSLAEATHDRPEIVAEFRVVWPDGSVHHIACRGQAFFNEDGELARVSGVSHDITERRLLEEEFRQAHKMEAIGQLAAGLAHDFNNVLTVIMGYCSLLMTNTRRRDSIQPALEEMLDAGQRAAALTAQLLAFGRKQVLQPRVVNLGVILEEMDRLVRRVIAEDIEVATNIDQDLDNVRIDPNQIQQVIMNLVVNARDSMPEGGRLTLELKNMELDAFSARTHDVPSGRYVLLAVSDSGIGMNPDVQRRVFEPFFTTKETGRGTGLGLSTVYGIVKQSGGHIWLYSEPGVGTTFRVILPRVNERFQSLPPMPSLSLNGGDETILVVEDDPEVRVLVQEILESVGYRIIVAEDGEDALRVAAECAGHIHLLITDVVMQKMGGRQSAEQLTAIRPAIKVLYMSGYTSDAILHHGILDQNVHFLAKPFTLATLCWKVRAVLDADIVIQRVLVVEDDRSVRELLAAILGDSGFEVIAVGDGREARAKARQCPIDLVITDLAMPEEEGIEMVYDLRSHYPHLKIIAMSGAFGPDVLKVAQMLGADVTLNKPLTTATVLQSIEDVRTLA